MKKLLFLSVGVLCLFVSLLLWPKSSIEKPKVYDCFLFFNELELLDIRLHEMAPYVDHFVIVEAMETFRGKSKPLYFAENASRYDAFKDKIIHVVVEEKLETENPWDREYFQREQIMRGLKDCHKNDVILISDVDEIVKGSCIPEIVRKISTNQAQAIVCEQKMFYGFLNHYQSPWVGTLCTSYDRVKNMTVYLTRKLRNGSRRKLRRAHINRFEKVKDGGWHFTSMGGMDRWILKIESYSHTKKSAHDNWKEGEEFIQTVFNATRVPIDDSFPKYVVDHQEYLEKIHFISSD